MHWFWPWMGGDWFLGSGLVALVVFIVVVWLVVRAVAGPLPPRRRWESDPEEVLRLRFARGEISEQEYRDRLAVLRGDRVP